MTDDDPWDVTPEAEEARLRERRWSGLGCLIAVLAIVAVGVAIVVAVLLLGGALVDALNDNAQ